MVGHRLAYESCFPVCGPGSSSRKGVPGNNLGTYDACPDSTDYRPEETNALESDGDPACQPYGASWRYYLY